MYSLSIRRHLLNVKLKISDPYNDEYRTDKMYNMIVICEMYIWARLS